MESRAAVESLGALAQDSRLQVYRLLVQAGAAGMAASEIAERLGVPANTLSFHLKALSHAHLVHARQDGRFIYYAERKGLFSYNVQFPLWQIVRFDRETGDTSTITNAQGSAMRPVLSPDGKSLVYATRFETGAAQPGNAGTPTAIFYAPRCWR